MKHNDNMNNPLTKAVVDALVASNDNANQLSIYSKVDRALIGRFLAGERSMTLRTADKLLAALGCMVRVDRPLNAGLTPLRKARRRKGR